MDATPAGSAPLAPSSRPLRTLCVATLAVFALLAAAGAQSASACVSPAFAPLALSTFEGADGDQCDSDGVGARRDWQNVASDPALSSTIDAPSDNDTIYGPNNAGIVGGSTDENTPDSWNFTHGSVGSGKFDALAASSFTDPENGRLFLDLGFVRSTTSGDTFLAFELNQRQPGYRLDPNEDDPAQPFSVPTRTRGDLLVTYHVGTAGAHELGLCVWDGDEHSGRWEEFKVDLSGAPITNQPCPALNSALYQAAINDGTGGRGGAISGTENYLDPGTAISAGQFGEAVVNLTDALRNPDNPTGPQPCVDFGYVWLHSRSSDSLSSSQQDFIMPDSAVSIGNCTIEGHKFNDLDGDGSQSVGEPLLGGWTIFVDYDGDGVLDNNMDATFVNDMDGIVEAGEEEPFDITADGTGTEALGSYRITKVQPSNASDPAGTWQVRELLQATWDCTAAVGGGAVLAPNVCPEDTTTTPDNALGFRLAWTDNQIYSGRDFGNKRQPGGLTVIKHVVNDDGGTASAGAWQLHVTDGGTDVAGSPQAGDENGDTYSLTHGQSVNVSETGGPTGYAASYSGDCDGTGDVTVSAGQTKTCTITNDDIAPVLTVIKHVINDNGGTKNADDFTVTVDDPGTNPASFAGAESPGTDVTVDPGAYTVSEGAHDGYAVSYSADCTSSLAIGETKTCTITNNDIAPVLTVIKHVINDNGGTKNAGDFQVTVDDPGTNPPSFAGAESPGTDVVVDPGSYSVSEGAHDGYAVSYSADCTSSLAIGQTKTCTITNNDIAPVLTVIKHVINDNGGTKNAGDFTVTVDDPGTNPPSFPGAESPGTDVIVDPGAYSVTEGAHDGYAVTYSADCTASLAIGQTKTCTITNDDIAATLTVIKHVINNDGGTKSAGDFTITVDDPGTNPAPFPGAESPGTIVAVDPGAYSVSEGAHEGYAVSYSAGCNGTAVIGQNTTCTITNDDIAPVLTVIKHVINNNGGTKNAGDFTVTVDDPGTNPPSFQGAESPGTDVIVDPGAYSVSEGSHDGYAVTYSADCTASLAIGQTKTCTITNDDIAATLTVIKHVINNDGGTKSAGDFTITVDDPGTNPAPFPGAESPGTIVAVDPGAYTVSEGAHDGYAVTYSADCTSSVTIGQTKTCTVTNDDIAPTLTVIKTVVNKHGSTATAADFTMHINGTAGTESFPGASTPGTTKTLHAGSFTVTETGPTADYDAQLAGCTGTLAVDEHKTCTITNTRKTGTITVVKDLIPATDDGRFNLRVDSTVVKANAADGDGSGPVEVNTGTHTVSEVAGSVGSLANYVKGISCSNGQNGAGATLDVTVTSGAQITCTITNRRVLAQPIVVKAGDTFAYHGDSVSYTFSVTNTGNSPLHDVHVADDKCPNVSSAPTSKTNDDGDALLDPIGANGTTPEVWVFTCSYTIGAHQGGEANPVVNTATVTALDELDRPVTDTDQHATTLLHPAIALAKTGPATALAGSLVTYQLSVTNTGDVAFPAPQVALTDARCDAPPLLISTGNDASTATLDPGDRWSYSCSVQTSVGQTVVHNIANVDGTDIHGRHATAQAIADTALTQPVAPTRGASPNPAPIVPLAPAAARLRGPSGCAPVTGRFIVTGTRILKVKFTVDGRRAKTVTKADKRGRYVYTVRRHDLRAGIHRIKAQITFLPGSTLKTKTLRMTSSRCRRAVLPAFTG